MAPMYRDNPEGGDGSIQEASRTSVFSIEPHEVEDDIGAFQDEEEVNMPLGSDYSALVARRRRQKMCALVCLLMVGAVIGIIVGMKGNDGNENQTTKSGISSEETPTPVIAPTPVKNTPAPVLPQEAPEPSPVTPTPPIPAPSPPTPAPIVPPVSSPTPPPTLPKVSSPPVLPDNTLLSPSPSLFPSAEPSNFPSLSPSEMPTDFYDDQY